MRELLPNRVVDNSYHYTLLRYWLQFELNTLKYRGFFLRKPHYLYMEKSPTLHTN